MGLSDAFGVPGFSAREMFISWAEDEANSAMRLDGFKGSHSDRGYRLLDGG